MHNESKNTAEGRAEINWMDAVDAPSERRYKLTPREIEICKLIQLNFSSKEIAGLLNISKQTVDKHRKNIRQKLNIKKDRVSLPSKLKEI